MTITNRYYSLGSAALVVVGVCVLHLLFEQLVVDLERAGQVGVDSIGQQSQPTDVQRRRCFAPNAPVARKSSMHGS